MPYSNKLLTHYHSTLWRTSDTAGVC